MGFPILFPEQKKKIVSYYSWGMVLFCVFYLLKATIRFILTNDSSVFFYHELVTKDVNAIHVSVFFSVAFFYFFTKRAKNVWEIGAAALLFVMIFLLASKNAIGVFIALIGGYYLFFSDVAKKTRMASLFIFLLLVCSLVFIPKIRDRFKIEYETVMTDNTPNTEMQGVRNISVRQAWNNETFTPADYFPGTAFRVYQFRIFLEMMAEDNAWLTGYGLNASYAKIEQKTISYNLFLGDGQRAGYQKKNFHNQYIQNFAELGIFGFLLLLAMLFVNLKNALKRKDFVHISFAVLMISLFLTESFLWRQRGVTFFTMMYCLFNSGIAIEKQKNL